MARTEQVRQVDVSGVETSLREHASCDRNQQSRFFPRTWPAPLGARPGDLELSITCGDEVARQRNRYIVTVDPESKCPYLEAAQRRPTIGGKLAATQVAMGLLYLDLIGRKDKLCLDPVRGKSVGPKECRHTAIYDVCRTYKAGRSV